MFDWTNQYTYLAAGIILLATFAGWLAIVSPRHRRAAIWSAALSVPTCLAEVFFIPDYWQPTRLTDGIIGVEDVMFCFAVGGLLWCIASYGWPSRCRLNLNPWRTVGRFALCFAFALSLGLALLPASLKPMTAAILISSTLGLGILAIRPELRWLSIGGAAVFTPVYFLFVLALFEFCPDYVNQWNEAGLWGHYVLGVPVDEIAWAAATGAVWPLVAGWCMVARRIDPPAQRKKSAEVTE